MFGKNKPLIVKPSKKGSRGKFPNPRPKKNEYEWYDSPEEIKKVVLKLLGIAFALFAIWFIYECISNWNIFS